MRIGIDETGDFSPTPATRDHFCVAIHPRREALERFLRWESSIGKNQRSNGEMKGRLLTSDQLTSFVAEVLERDPAIRVRPVLLRPTEEPGQVIASLRESTRLGLRGEARALMDAGSVKEAHEVEQCAAWIAALNDSGFLWLNAMTTCVGAALYDVLVDATAGGYTDELDDLKISVDQRTIRAGNLAGRSGAVQAVAWFLQADSAATFAPIERVLTEMEDNHPFARRWRTKERRWPLVSMLESICNFSARSDDHPEIRIADVVAAIFSRASNRVDTCALGLHARCVALVGGSAGPLRVRLAQS